MICLDTNIVIAYLKRGPTHLVERFQKEVFAGHLALPVPVLSELHYGVAKSARQVENRGRLTSFLQLPIAVLPFDAADAEEAGNIRAALARAGTPIGPYDVMIAAQARRRGAILITANTGEFSRVPGLAIENWLAGAPA